MPKKIVVDPFFDGGAPQAATADAELSRMIPSGPGGLRGTVIPRADEVENPTEWKGVESVRTEIHIDPDIPGQSTVVRLDALQSDRVEAAMKETSQVDPRIRASAVYNALSVDGPASPPDPVVQDNGRNGEAPRQQPVSNNGGPLQAFNVASESIPTEKVKMPDKMRPTAPTMWVTFEIDGFGEHRAPYHRVIRSNSSLVLVYDTRCDGAQRFFPRTTDKPLGIHVTGESVAYYAHTTGIEFSDAGVDYCVLLIEHEAPLTANTANTDNEVE